ncbi:MAG: hypothetical protein Q8P97_00800 [bacterium]|nr:hypothetical protein [bacterium]
MKYSVSLILIISFVGIAIFGSALLDMGHNHVDTGCVASTIDGMACPTNVMNMTLHHISALQTLTRTIVPSIPDGLLLLASLLLVSVSMFLFYKNLLFPKLKFLPQRLRDLTLHSLYSQRKIISWLSLFELSPTWQ